MRSRGVLSIGDGDGDRNWYCQPHGDGVPHWDVDRHAVIDFHGDHDSHPIEHLLVHELVAPAHAHPDGGGDFKR